MPNVTRLFEKKPTNNKSIKEKLQKFELAETQPSRCEKYDIDLLEITTK